MIRTVSTAVLVVLAAPCGAALADESRDAIAAPTGTSPLKVHALGAQIYDCRTDSGGHLAWTFREPVASLMSGGKTVGRHYAGPTWEMADGSLVVGKVVAKAPGLSAADIPWLKLAVSERKGDGSLKDVTTVQRIATEGGTKDGPCPVEGASAAQPYAADYIFSRP